MISLQLNINCKAHKNHINWKKQLGNTYKTHNDHIKPDKLYKTTLRIILTLQKSNIQWIPIPSGYSESLLQRI